MATVIGDLVVRLRGDTAQFEKSMRGVDARLSKMGKKMRSAGRSMTMGLSLPIAGVGIAAVKMAGDLDMTLSRVVGLVGRPREEVKAWREDIIELSPMVNKSANELAEALFFVTSAGIRGAAVMKTVQAAAMGAAAGLGDTAVVADASTSAMNAYAKSNLSAEQATAILVATVREGKAEAASLAPVLGAVMPIAANLGVSFDQLGAAMAAMTRLGLDASLSATALRATLSQLSKVTPAQEKAAMDLGLSFKELRKIIREKGLLDALMLLKERIGDNDVAFTKVFPNIRALTGVLAMVGDAAEETRGIFDRMAKTTGKDLVDAFQAAEEQAMFKFGQALRELQTLLIRIGDDLLPSLVTKVENLGTAAQLAADAWMGMDDATKSWILSAAGLLLVLGPLLSIIGFMATGIAAVAGATAAITATIVSVAGLVSAFVGVGGLTASIGLAISLSAGLVAGLVILAGGIGALIGDAIRPWVNETLFLNEALGLIAEKNSDMTAGLAKSQTAYESQHFAFVKLRKQLKLTGKEWEISAEHTKENARRLGVLTEKAIVLARKKSALNATIREGVEAWDANAAAAVESTHAEVSAIEQATAAESQYLDELMKKYEVLSKDDIAEQMASVADDFAKLKDTVDKTQLAEKFNEPMLKLAKLANENKVAIPKPFADAAAHLGDKLIPGVQKMIDLSTTFGGNFTTQGKVIEGMFEAMGPKLDISLQGGFKNGVEKGIEHGTVAMDKWVLRLENDTIYLPVMPSFEEWNKAVDDHINGRVPDTGG